MDEFQKLVARINATAFFLTDDSETEVKFVKRKKHRITKKVEELPAAHRDALVRLLCGEAVLVSWDAMQYAAWKDGESWRVLGLYSDAEGVHTVADAKCSCPDAKFRGHACKHLLLLQHANLLGGS